MHEKRLTSRLVNYWERLRKEAPLPDFAQWNPSSIDDIWANCLVMVAEPDAGDENIFKYTHVGGKIEGTWGKNFAGKKASSKSSRVFRGASIIKRIDEVVTSAAPVLDEGKFVGERNKLVKYRSCLLPFGSAETGITHIIVGLSWKEFG